MKTLITFVLGITVGVVATILFYQTTHHKLRQQAINALVDELRSAATNDLAEMNPPGREEIKLHDDQMFLISSPQGRAVVDFTHFGTQDSESTYRWRFKPASEHQEISGTGTVYERYARTQTSTNSYDIKDIGSKLTVTAGPFEIEWSYSSTDSGWFYYDSQRMNIVALPDTDFETALLNQ